MGRVSAEHMAHGRLDGLHVSGVETRLRLIIQRFHILACRAGATLDKGLDFGLGQSPLETVDHLAALEGDDSGNATQAELLGDLRMRSTSIRARRTFPARRDGLFQRRASCWQGALRGDQKPTRTTRFSDSSMTSARKSDSVTSITPVEA